MPLTRRDTPEGTVWVRPPFRPEDYTAPPDAVQLFERWRGDAYPSEEILAMRDGPFGNYVEVGREERGGATWLVLLEASREFALEVERISEGQRFTTKLLSEGRSASDPRQSAPTGTPARDRTT